MKYNKKTKELITDNGQILKKVECPMEMIKYEAIGRRMAGDYEFFKCAECKKDVVNINGLNEKDVIKIFKNEKDACVTFSVVAENFEIEDDVVRLDNITMFDKNNVNSLPVISTARNVYEINEAVEDGYNVIVKEIIDNPEIGSSYTLIKDKEGVYYEISDPRGFGYKYYQEGNETIIDFKRYNNLSNRIPYAAYIIPKDLKVGTRVFLEDIIENIVHTMHHGCTRLNKCEAVFNGKDFDIDFSRKDIIQLVG
jgi:hypothetical protein